MNDPGGGKAYTFVALDLESRAVIAFQVGRRDPQLSLFADEPRPEPPGF